MVSCKLKCVCHFIEGSLPNSRVLGFDSPSKPPADLTLFLAGQRQRTLKDLHAALFALKRAASWEVALWGCVEGSKRSSVVLEFFKDSLEFRSFGSGPGVECGWRFGFSASVSVTMM